MKKQHIVDVLQPAYFKEFSCTGDKCPDHCCHSWGVSINKQSYKKLKKHSDPVVKKLAIESFKLVRKSEGEWAFIRMNDDGNCPCLDSEGLCEMHKRCGHDAIPHTCQDYPRVANWFGEHVESSLYLSCPAAAEHVLFNPAAMTFESSQQVLTSLNNGNTSGMFYEDLPPWMNQVREFCFSIILDGEAPFFDRMFSLGLFLKQIQPHLDDQAMLEQVMQQFIQSYNDGKYRAMFEKLPTVAELGWEVFAEQDKQLVENTSYYEQRTETDGLSTSAKRFQECREQVMTAIAKLQSKDQQDTVESIEADAESFAAMKTKAMEQYVWPYFEERPYILVNYAMYYIFHFQFMHVEKKTPFEFFRFMATDIHMIMSYLCGIAINQEEITDEWVIKLFQSYSRRRQHNREFITRMQEQMAASGIESAGAVLGLLKC